MGRILKWLFYLLVLAGLFLVAYAYVGPFLGVDFSARPEPVSVPVGLGLD